MTESMNENPIRPQVTPDSEDFDAQNNEKRRPYNLPGSNGAPVMMSPTEYNEYVKDYNQDSQS